MTDSAPQRAAKVHAPPSGGMMFNLKARVELACARGGPCTLVHKSWLSAEKVETFTVEEIQGATLERNRSSKRGGEQVFRPVLETTRGKFPLCHQWMDEQEKAENTVRVVNAFHDNPMGGGGRGFILFHDQRRGSAIVGASFSSVGVVLLGVSVWLGFKARRHRRAERATRSS